MSRQLTAERCIRTARTVRCRRSERGSALIVVFVLAAVIAIMLYREMPVAAFEARRTKEQMLVDRGHEYQRGVQLYYRKFRGQYPASFDQLENTNSMRFLRRRYTDPFTGKDDWRLLHAGGPNGALIDSKVNPINQNKPNQNGQTQSAANGFGGSSSSAFGQNAGSASPNSTFGSTTFNSTSSNSTSSFGSASSADTGATVEVPAVRRRGAAVDATVGAGSGQTPSSGDLAQDPTIPLLPPNDPSASGATANAQPGSNANGAATVAGQNGVAPANGPGQGNNSMQSVQNLFNSGPSLPAGQTTAGALAGQPGASVSTTGTSGQLSSGGLAGVASKANGHTIKTVNDQTNYDLWEFWYDPTKDTSMGSGSNAQNGAGGQNVQNGTALGQPANGNGFGTSSGFGSNSNTNNSNSNSSTSGFGQSTSPSPTTGSGSNTTNSTTPTNQINQPQ